MFTNVKTELEMKRRKGLEISLRKNQVSCILFESEIFKCSVWTMCMLFEIMVSQSIFRESKPIRIKLWIIIRVRFWYNMYAYIRVELNFFFDFQIGNPRKMFLWVKKDLKISARLIKINLCHPAVLYLIISGKPSKSESSPQCAA